MENIEKAAKDNAITILILALSLSLSVTAQTRISLTQDARLAFVGDDKGNNAFTPNLTFRASQFINGTKDFNFLAYADYEHADLQGGSYNRAGIGFGLNFHKIIKNVEFQVMYGIGKIFRHQKTFDTWDLVGNISYKITPKLSLLIELQQTKRNDIYRQPFVYSGKVGFRVEFF